ncbi:tetratricopeptide repeat protein [Candidatus Venteria ishoeyi]|uniref:tetratricopeptide repeat protein n=1 Tax=Candidatus Venteria ishoeyi TaxID=1899563 RepID=UPI0025A6232D|nr:tetratricopeptide repeat protein [Candidatus Venteria ishoeyi]MDM8547043.1 tetratricopeptide repeat protein [Candidatus Venteria ishoeyi]
MRKILVLTLCLLLSCAVQAAELSREQFMDQFLSAVQAKDAEKISQLLQENPATARKIQRALQAVEGEAENAQQARALGGLLGELLGASAQSGDNAAGSDIAELQRLHREAEQAWNHSDYPTALEKWEQGLKLARQLKNRQAISAFIGNLGAVYDDLGQYAKALEYYEQALAIHREIGDRAGEGGDLNNITVLHETQGDYSKARDSYQQALTLFSKTGEPENLWMVWKNLYEVMEKLNNPNAAIFYGKQAINTIQRLRTHVARLDDKTLSQSFLKDKKHVYEELADLLMSQGRLFLAPQREDLQKRLLAYQQTQN